MTRILRRGGLRPIAELIRQHSGGHLDAVVVSHRHEDHLSAFGQADIAALLAEDGPPSLIVRSWTEDPDAERDAVKSKRRTESARFLTACARPEASPTDCSDMSTMDGRRISRTSSRA